MNLSSKGKLAVLMTSTPICPGDLCDKVETDVAWKTTKFKAVIEWPEDVRKNGWDGLWGRYFAIYDKENTLDRDHSESLKFYKDNFDAMNKGAKTFADRFKESDGHISALQAVLEKRHVIGRNAFEAEMQMAPVKKQFALDITPKDVVSKTGAEKPLQIPDGFVFVAAATDLNVSYAITTTIIAYRRDMSALVVHHSIRKVRIDGRLNDTEYSKAVYGELVEVGRELASFNLNLNGWGIDAGGRNFQAVTDFARNSSRLCGVPACAMIGRASHIFNPFVKSRLRDAVDRTVLCGDQREQIKAGSGAKYIFFDSDVYRERCQRAFLSPLGSPGGCQLYDADPEEHAEFSIQVTNEAIRFVRHRQDGRSEYSWTSKEPHDYLDTVAMCYAIAGSSGISGGAAAAAERPA